MKDEKNTVETYCSVSHEELLEKRAAALAQADNAFRDDELQEEILVFELEGEQYGFHSNRVDEVLSINTVLQLPRTPPAVAGIANVRGVLHPVVDLKVLFNLQTKSSCEMKQVLIVSYEDMTLAILADTVTGIRSIDSDYRNSIPELSPALKRTLHGLSTDRVAVLKVDQLFKEAAITGAQR